MTARIPSPKRCDADGQYRNANVEHNSLGRFDTRRKNRCAYGLKRHP
ncbi:hypothetical protein BURPS1710A_A1550 [Burkholderia pseudomallei 1710a]|uniref:Uncharacterized protein n=1 Tax=Burkholderia pseudomallei 1710a TaxID=320371 RepID=A0A0E1W2I1_BURPE|nr:hypothetical protein BURPS1710A_A1550 [Burkholderia pseudomallei 1710a]